MADYTLEELEAELAARQQGLNEPSLEELEAELASRGQNIAEGIQSDLQNETFLEGMGRAGQGLYDLVTTNPLTTVGNLASGVGEFISDPLNPNNLRPAASLVGSAAGTLAGGALGSFLGPIGTGTGAVLGGNTGSTLAQEGLESLGLLDEQSLSGKLGAGLIDSTVGLATAGVGGKLSNLGHKTPKMNQLKRMANSPTGLADSLGIIDETGTLQKAASLQGLDDLFTDSNTKVFTEGLTSKATEADNFLKSTSLTALPDSENILGDVENLLNPASRGLLSEADALRSSGGFGIETGQKLSDTIDAQFGKYLPRDVPMTVDDFMQTQIYKDHRDLLDRLKDTAVSSPDPRQRALAATEYGKIEKELQKVIGQYQKGKVLDPEAGIVLNDEVLPVTTSQPGKPITIGSLEGDRLGAQAAIAGKDPIAARVAEASLPSIEAEQMRLLEAYDPKLASNLKSNRNLLQVAQETKELYKRWESSNTSGMQSYMKTLGGKMGAALTGRAIASATGLHGVAGWMTSETIEKAIESLPARLNNAQTQQFSDFIDVARLQKGLEPLQTPGKIGKTVGFLGDSAYYAGMAHVMIPGSQVSVEATQAMLEPLSQAILQANSQPQPGEDPQIAMQRATALQQDFVKVMTQGTAPEKRLMISNLQKWGLIPPNPIEGEVDGFIEDPELRNKFLVNLEADMQSGKITKEEYMKQLIEMNKKSGGGRILTPTRLIQQTPQTLPQMPAGMPPQQGVPQ